MTDAAHTVAAGAFDGAPARERLIAAVGLFGVANRLGEDAGADVEATTMLAASLAVDALLDLGVMTPSEAAPIDRTAPGLDQFRKLAKFLSRAVELERVAGRRVERWTEDADEAAHGALFLVAAVHEEAMLSLLDDLEDAETGGVVLPAAGAALHSALRVMLLSYRPGRA